MSARSRLRDWQIRGLNWTLAFWAALIYGLLAVTAVLGVDVRVVSTLYGFAATAGLTYRLATTWWETSVLVHALGALLLLTVALGAFGQAQILTSDLPVPKTWVIWPLLVVRATAIIVVVKWPKWTDRKYSPLLANPPRNGR